MNSETEDELDQHYCQENIVPILNSPPVNSSGSYCLEKIKLLYIGRYIMNPFHSHPMLKEL